MGYQTMRDPHFLRLTPIKQTQPWQGLGLSWPIQPSIVGFRVCPRLLSRLLDLGQFQRATPIRERFDWSAVRNTWPSHVFDPIQLLACRQCTRSEAQLVLL